MKNVKLSHRLIIGFGLLLLGMGVLGGIALTGLAQLRGLGRELVEHSLSGMYHAAAVRENTVGSSSLLRTLVLDEDKAQRQAILAENRKTIEAVSAARAEYERSILADEDRRLFRESNEARDAFSKAREKIIALVEEDKLAEARALYGEAAVPAFQTYLTTVNALVDYNKRRGDEVGKEIVEAISGTTGGIWVSFIVLTLLGVAGAVLIGRSVVSAVRAVLEHVGRVGQGDLDARCAYDGQDEIGQLARELDKMAEELKSARDVDKRNGAQQEESRQQLQKKVDAILASVQAVAQGDLTQHVPVSGSDAVGQLGEGFSRLIDDLHVRSPRQHMQPLMVFAFASDVADFTRAIAVVDRATKDLFDLLAHERIKRTGGRDNGALLSHCDAFPLGKAGKLIDGLRVGDDEPGAPGIDHSDISAHRFRRHAVGVEQDAIRQQVGKGDDSSDTSVQNLAFKAP